MASPVIRCGGRSVYISSKQRYGSMYFWGCPVGECIDGQIAAPPVHPKRKGIGSRLLKRLLHEHKRFGKSDKVCAITTYDNKACIALFQKHGFRFDPVLTLERNGYYRTIIVLSRINKRYKNAAHTQKESTA